jgi:flavin reductase (DIM6/NTAB) family NADH-FMN oxidoreductase RutF
MDNLTFKSIMGSFPSGVSVVTVTDLDGTPRGLTCSSVCSVSLEPAMLLVCVNKNSNTLPVLEERGSFVVNFLCEQSADIARICASKAADKFSGVRWRMAEYADNAPILIDHITAYAECRIIQAVDGGDHIILIARILTGATYPAKQPMIYARGKVKQLAKSEAFAA